MTDYSQSAEKRIDLEDVRPVAFDGGTAILARTYRTTSFSTEIDPGEIPVAVSGVYSPMDLKRSLQAAGFDAKMISRAIEHELRGSNATKAVAHADRQAGNVEVLA